MSRTKLDLVLRDLAMLRSVDFIVKAYALGKKKKKRRGRKGKGGEGKGGEGDGGEGEGGKRKEGEEKGQEGKGGEGKEGEGKGEEERGGEGRGGTLVCLIAYSNNYLIYLPLFCCQTSRISPLY